jgi:MFS family permease
LERSLALYLRVSYLTAFLVSIPFSLLAVSEPNTLFRKNPVFLILSDTVVFCIGSALQCFASEFIHLIIGRAIGGIGVGALSMLSPLYMAEISPPEVRGSLMALEQFAIVLGVVMGFWLGFFTRAVPGSASWRIPLGVQLIPGVLLGIGCLFLPSSPRLLVLQNRNEEALKALARLRLRSANETEDDPLLQIELLEMRVETTLIQRSFHTDEQKGGLRAELRAWSRLFNREYRPRTFIGVLMMFFQRKYLISIHFVCKTKVSFSPRMEWH